MIADEVLKTPAKVLCDVDDYPLGLVESDKFGRVTRADKVLKFASLQKFMSTHKIEVDFIFLVPSH